MHSQGISVSALSRIILRCYLAATLLCISAECHRK